MYRVAIEKKALKQLKRLPAKHQRRLWDAIDSLATRPLAGKKMRGEYHGMYSLRVWPYRIIYRVEKKKITVYVLAIGHRQGIYG